jgi:phenylacetate-CoA ligase
VALPHLKKALVSGEAFPPRCATGWPSAASQAYQCYATADVGLIAYETARARAWWSTKA